MPIDWECSRDIYGCYVLIRDSSFIFYHYYFILYDYLLTSSHMIHSTLRYGCHLTMPAHRSPCSRNNLSANSGNSHQAAKDCSTFAIVSRRFSISNPAAAPGVAKPVRSSRYSQEVEVWLWCDARVNAWCAYLHAGLLSNSR